MNRRDLIKSLTALPFLTYLDLNGLMPISNELLTRFIPSTREKLPIVGLGTWQTFDVGSSTTDRQPLMEVMQKLVELGAMVVDSSPMYGRSEGVVGDLSSELQLKDELFMATKVWISGKQAGMAQMEQSMERMKKRPMDLMQIHNLVDWKTHMKTLMDWKAEGKVRYIGITHYLESAYARLEQVMKEYPIDFVQLNYSIASREAENRLLPLARDKGIAVLTNRPYEGGSLFRKVKGQSLPDWAEEMDCKSWGQFFLKYILANEAVTCAIPGTSKVKHLVDNLGAGMGPLPNAAQQSKMVRHLKSL